ncbi:MAG: hypothetical protein ACJ8FK_23220 [Xanthobacteraceae bacterium]
MNRKLGLLFLAVATTSAIVFLAALPLTFGRGVCICNECVDRIAAEFKQAPAGLSGRQSV